MENKHKNQFKGRHDSAVDFKSQLIIFCQYLQKYTATASMVSAATGIPQKNVTRYKRILEKDGRLWQIERKPCKKTGFKAWYLSTNPDLQPQYSKQLCLF